MRSKKEVDNDYSQNAIMYGHKQRIIKNLMDEIEKLGAECEDHLKKLIELNDEGMKLPQVAPVQEATPDVAV